MSSPELLFVPLSGPETQLKRKGLTTALFPPVLCSGPRLALLVPKNFALEFTKDLDLRSVRASSSVPGYFSPLFGSGTQARSAPPPFPQFLEK